MIFRIVLVWIIFFLVACDDKKLADEDSLLFRDGSLAVVSVFHKTMDYPTTRPKESKCRGWTLSNDDITLALRGMRIANGIEWDYFCSPFRCGYEGKIEHNGKTYEATLNAGAFAFLSAKGEDSVILIQQDKSNYFLEPCAVPSEEHL